MNNYHSFKFIYDFNNKNKHTHTLSISLFLSLVHFIQATNCLFGITSSPQLPVIQTLNSFMKSVPMFLFPMCNALHKCFLASEIIIVVDKIFWIVLLKIPLVHIAFYPFSISLWHMDLLYEKNEENSTYFRIIIGLSMFSTSTFFVMLEIKASFSGIYVNFVFENSITPWRRSN